ncbi:NAD(P)/FAD-dependent oxidoreductase [Agromyces tropicus]|uniref:NAD(P)/FAD-dependent oxidoreductase n=1 Tax=Agromyces tropicus TaxID=555371 RepID=A0ABP5GBV1_9MICO
MNHVEVAIVGAGFAGIAMAMRLRREGRESFAILERGADIGGTWRENTYPGIACDVPSHLYCFANHPNPAWERVYARGPEIQAYLRRVVRDEGLHDHLALRSPLIGAARAEGVWQLDVGGAAPRRITADSLILACGRLSEPRVPAIDGLETFPGPIFHSARWDHSAQVRGTRMAVVGTGASAVQLVPELVRRGAHVTLFQRTPAWIMPRGDRAYHAGERAAFASDPGAIAQLRQSLFLEGEARYAARSGEAIAARAAREIALAHLAAQVSDPDLRRDLTPDYAFGCKRVLLSDDFYPALDSGEVALEPTALHAIRGRTLVAAGGTRHEADAIVLATGFETTRQPYAQLVRGSDGTTLDDHWATGMRSFASTLVSGFPDLYILNGPNASLGHNSAVLMMEEQAEFVVRCLAARDRAPGASVEVDLEQELAYTAEIEDRSAPTPWITGGCRNWYVDDRSGRLTLLWPGTVQMFRERLARADIASLTRAHSRGSR